MTTGTGLDSLLTVPREVLERIRDELERLPDWYEPGTTAHIAYHQLEALLKPDPQFVTPIPTMASRHGENGDAER